MHCTDKYPQHDSIIWPVWLNGQVFAYKLSGCGFKSCCSHIQTTIESRFNLKCICNMFREYSQTRNCFSANTGQNISFKNWFGDLLFFKLVICFLKYGFISFNKSLLKLIKNTFYFILKALFIVKIRKFLF